MKHFVPWPPDREAELRRLIRRGLTDPEIAYVLQLSLRAVQGKRQRMKLEPNPQKRGRKEGGRNTPKPSFADGPSRICPACGQMKRAAA